MAIRVQAKRKGLYGRMIRPEGSVFTIKDESQLGKWMKRLDKGGAAKEDTAPRKPVQKSRGAGKKHELERIKGVGVETRDALIAAGIGDIFSFAEKGKAEPAVLTGLPGITEDNLPNMLEQVDLMLAKELGDEGDEE